MSKYPPCMMMPQQYRDQPKSVNRKGPNLLREFIKFQEFMDNKAKANVKQPDPPPTGKGMWHWVEETPPSKLGVLESTAILLLLSIPVAAIEVYGGAIVLRWAAGG